MPFNFSFGGEGSTGGGGLNQDAVQALIDAALLDFEVPASGITEVQVRAIVDAANTDFLDAAGINSLVTALGYLTPQQAQGLIDAETHLTNTQVATLITNAGHLTSAQVSAVIASESQDAEEVQEAIAQAGHASAGTVSAVNTARITGDAELADLLDAEANTRADADAALQAGLDDVVATGGGLAEVTSDDTLDGTGTADSPIGLADSSLLSEHFTIAAVPRDALPDNVINQPKIADDAVATAKIPDDNVTEPKLSGAVRAKLNVIGATPASVIAERDLRVAGDADLDARLTALQHVQSVTKVGNHFHVTTVIDGVATTEQLLDVSGAGNIADGTILYGAGIPASSLGVDGDAYLDNGTGHFYKKGNGVWLQIADAVLIHELTEAVNSLTLLINAKADAAALVQEVQDRAAAITVLTERLDGRNEFTDGEKLKLGNVEAGATADQDLSALATGAALANEAETRSAADIALGVLIENLPAPVASGGSGNGIVTFEDYHVSAAVSLSVSNRLVATGIVIPEAERTGYWLINFGTVGGYVSGAEFIMDASKLFALPGQVSGTERNLSESLCFTDAIGQGFDACLGHTGIGQILYSSNSAAADTDGITIKRLATRSSVAEVQLFRGDIRKQTPTVIQLAEEIPADVDGVRNVLEISFDTANYMADVDDNGDPTGTETIVNDVGRNLITLPAFNARDLNALDEYVTAAAVAVAAAANGEITAWDKVPLYTRGAGFLFSDDRESDATVVSAADGRAPGVFIMRSADIEGGLLRNSLVVQVGVPAGINPNSSEQGEIVDAANFTVRLIKY